MAYLHTCVGCSYASGNCDRRNDIKTAIRGLGISSVKHRCAESRPIYQRGVPVKILTVSSTDGNLNEYSGVVRDWFNATLVSQKGGRVIAFVAEGTRGESSDVPFETGATGYVKAPLSRTKPSDHEPITPPEDRSNG